VEPDDAVWSKIRTAVTAIKPDAAMRLPEVTSAPAPVAPPVVQEITPTNVVSLSDRGRRWRSLAQLTTALAASLAAFVAVQAYRPDLLPEKLRPQPRVDVVQVQAPQPAQFVAVLQRDGGSPAFILTLDTNTKEFTVRKAGADAPAGRAYELWMVSDRFNAPRSLGVIGATDFTTKPGLAQFDSPTIHGAIYAVTVEPEGGSPTGAPTSAPIYAGKLIETVPAASTPPPPPPAKR
jgi:anti-sigma-K factor RskA